MPEDKKQHETYIYMLNQQTQNNNQQEPRHRTAKVKNTTEDPTNCNLDADALQLKTYEEQVKKTKGIAKNQSTISQLRKKRINTQLNTSIKQ